MATQKISVTELKIAVLDPAWRARWQRGEHPDVPKPIQPIGTPPVKGQLFHRLAEAFTHWLCRGRARRTAHQLTTAEALWDSLYERFAARELSELVQHGALESALHLSHCLQAWCARLAELRATVPGFTAWTDLFLDEEMALREIPLSRGNLRVSGRIDAVRHRRGEAIEIVEYKLSRGANLKQDLLQLAIYAQLFSRAKPGLPYTGLLEYYEPKLQTLAVTADALNALFKEQVLPILEQLGGPAAGQKTPPAQPSSLPKHPPASPPDESDHSALITATFKAFKLEVEVVGKIDAPQLTRYQVRPAPGVKVVSLANRAEDLQVRLGLQSPPRIEPSAGYISIDLPKAAPETVYWRSLQQTTDWRAHVGPMAFPVGLGVDGRLLVSDFADPNTCHALVAGTSGSGKSEFLKSMAASLIARHRPEALQITLIDPKILSFVELQGSPYLTGPIISELPTAIACLEAAVESMEARYRQLAKEGFVNIAERYAQGKTDLPFRLIIFDEFADLILAGKQEKKRFENLVSRLAAKGRAAGLHLVLATQRPDRSIVTGPIKANLPLRICLKVTSAVNSQIILDEPGGEALVGRGDLLCDLGKGRIERAQSPYLPPGELREIAHG